jgi:type II secretory pathway component HofQ
MNAFSSESQVPKPELRKELVKLKYIRAKQMGELLLGYQSEYGRIRINDELNVMTIQDTPEIVDKMLSVVNEIDVKPVDILFTVELIVGSFEEELEEVKVVGKKASSKGLESDPLMKEMQRVMSFKTLYKIGSALMRVQDGKYSEQIIGGSGHEFKLALTPRYVREEKEDTFQVNIELRHDRVVKVPGGLRPEKNVRLIETAFTLRSGDKTIVGVSKLDGGDKALILVISGKVIK